MVYRNRGTIDAYKYMTSNEENYTLFRRFSLALTTVARAGFQFCRSGAL